MWDELPNAAELYGGRARTWRGAVAAAAVLAIWGALSGVHRIALALDHLLFPRFRQVAVRRPLFIVGPPRNGTTLLHRLIATQEPLFTTMPLWELLLAPAICEKYVWLGLWKLDASIGGPVCCVLAALQRRMFRHGTAIHATSLMSPEEDYLALLPYRACFLLVVAFPFSPALWRLGRFDEQISSATRQRLLRTYRRLVQRHLFVRGVDRHYLSKNPAFCSWIESLRSEFPDARLVAPLREPVSAVTSQLSSLKAAMRMCGSDICDPRIRDRFIDLLSHYYQKVTEGLDRMPPGCRRRIAYRELVSCPWNELCGMLVDLGYPAADLKSPEPALTRLRDSRPLHQHAPADFGLTPGLILDAFPTAVVEFIDRGEPVFLLDLEPQQQRSHGRLQASAAT